MFSTRGGYRGLKRVAGMAGLLPQWLWRGRGIFPGWVGRRPLRANASLPHPSAVRSMDATKRRNSEVVVEFNPTAISLRAAFVLRTGGLFPPC